MYVHIATALFLALLGKILHYNFQLRANSRTLARNNLALQQSEQRLRESEDHLRRITESLGEGLLITDPDDVVLYANTRLTEMTGFTLGDLLGRPAYELLLPPEAHSRMRERNRARNRDISEQYEIEILDKNGQSFWTHIHATPFRNNTGEFVGTLGAITDISERKQLETQLLHAQKVDTIGQLTAGIAHNFNNMLLGIMGNIEFAIMEGPEHIKPFLNESYRICEQVADMVSQLMAYSHHGVHTAHEPFDPTAIIARTISFCQSTFDRKISIETDCGDDLPTILGDAGQIEQSLLNLMLNARDALANLDGRMPSICLSADIVTLDGEAAALVADAEEGTFLRLQVSDNGAGMDETTRQRIFDRFFTTKAIGQGTGLGLSTVYGTARLHGGWVSCESAPGQGATFALYFPPAPDAPCQTEAPLPESATTGGETVLVIDDEESVRTILSRGLSAHGYATMQATNGREALEILQGHHIDLILLDLSMLQVSGHDVLAELHKTDSSAKIIVCTGYAAAREQFAGVADVLQKPIGLTELVRKVRRALDTPQP